MKYTRSCYGLCKGEREMLDDILTTTSLIIVVNFSWYLISLVVDTYFKGRVNLGFSRKIASEKEAYDARIKAELVADLIAEWKTFPEDTAKLRALSYKAFLWLPKPLAEEISKLLSDEPGQKTIREILILTRQHILKKTDPLPEYLIIDFDLSAKEQERRADYALNKAKAHFEKQGCKVTIVDAQKN